MPPQGPTRLDYENPMRARAERRRRIARWVTRWAPLLVVVGTAGACASVGTVLRGAVADVLSLVVWMCGPAYVLARLATLRKAALRPRWVKVNQALAAVAASLIGPWLLVVDRYSVHGASVVGEVLENVRHLHHLASVHGWPVNGLWNLLTSDGCPMLLACLGCLAWFGAVSLVYRRRRARVADVDRKGTKDPKDAPAVP